MMKRWHKLLLGLALLAGLAPARANNAPDIAGAWARNDGNVRIAIAPCGGQLCAVNQWVKNPNGPEHIGDELILTLKPAADGTLKGRAFDVRRHLNFSMTISLQGQAMQTDGCVLLGIVCKAADWTRIGG